MVNLEEAVKVYQAVEQTGDLSIFDTIIENIKKDDGDKQIPVEIYSLVKIIAKSNFEIGTIVLDQDNITPSQLLDRKIKKILKDPKKCNLEAFLVVLIEMQDYLSIPLSPIRKKSYLIGELGPITALMSL